MKTISFYIKKSFLLLFITVTIEAYSQEESLIFGLGPTLELEESLVGVNARAYFGLNEQICFGPEVSYYSFQSIGEGAEKSILDLNINLHYIFDVTERLGIYPLTGVNYTLEDEQLINNSSTREEEEEFGINYGAGIHYKVANNLFVFTEFKGIVGQLSAEFITAGLILDIPFKKEKEE